MLEHQKNDRDLNDLARSILYEEVPNQNLMRLTILVIGAAFILFVLWSCLTNVNEVARMKGEIIPSGYAQIVQHLEGGLIDEILIEEGDLVEKGQVLIRMGGIGAEEDYASLNARQTTLKLQAERLRALAYDKAPDFQAIAGQDEDAIAYQEHILETTRQSYDAEMKVIEDQRAQKQQAIERLNAEKNTMEKELSSAKELFDMKEQMTARGGVSKKDLIDSEREITRLDGNIRSIDAQLAEAQNALSEYQNRLQTLNATRRDTALRDLEEIESQIYQNKEMLGKLEERVARMDVRAPVRGLVQGLRVNTVGGIIGAGEPIMEIVPLDQTLIVEAHVAPRDIGNLQVGQAARVKVSAFDFSRYGVIEGKLDFISATTFTDPDNQSFYKGRIVLQQNHVGPNPERNLILPGMTVEADIITGHKTVMAYLIKPIHRVLSSAFSER
ncbi:MAG: HlyD family type I secretion periplasmic adaptor subunit [Alphaproteobacteria bacterium]|nr:secretion protein HlyD [Alphaproteobacteria bacterium]MCS5598001.1 HlyD family type I secretion periplasmic adaptor subunit [Alphaproteobacteria bacterium]|tara:strand:+ start:97057 stop:98382 length:1326 start_codon:yes stop_codon:yes gene_type:complete